MKLVKDKIWMISACLFVTLVLIAGCNSKEVPEKNTYSLSLAGESDNWEIESYEVTLSPEKLKAGNGTLTMKNNTDYKTDFLNIETHTVIGEQDHIIQQKQVSGETGITQTNTGTIAGGNFLNEDGKAVELDAVEGFYMIIEWRDRKRNETVTERIDLFS